MKHISSAFQRFYTCQSECSRLGGQGLEPSSTLIQDYSRHSTNMIWLYDDEMYENNIIMEAWYNMMRYVSKMMEAQFDNNSMTWWKLWWYDQWLSMDMMITRWSSDDECLLKQWFRITADTRQIVLNTARWGYQHHCATVHSSEHVQYVQQVPITYRMYALLYAWHKP